jgi:hypothetical protein
MKKILVIIAIVFGVILIVLIVLNLVTNLELKTEVVFDAPKEKVWEVLTDTDKYSEWNPFITSVEGEMKQGARITNVMVNQGKENTFTPVITAFEEYKLLEWLGSGLGGMFNGNHYFKLTEIKDDKTKMLHGEKFSGLLSGLIIQMIGKDTYANFELMNNAMKQRVEEFSR